MKMKFKYIVLGACLALSTTSCEKWLDVTASDQIKSEDLFKTADGFRDALLGVYINMTVTTSYGQDMTWNLVDLLSQQYATLASSGLYYGVQIFNYTATRSVERIEPLWYNQYKTIANVNNILGQLEKESGVLSKTEYAIIKGELLALRAFLHFDLIRVFGHGNYVNRPELATKPTIPYSLAYSKNPVPQQSYADTFILLEKDLSEALELLKEDPAYPATDRPANYYSEINRNGFYNDRDLRMNYFAAKAVQSRVLAWQGKLEDAAIAAEDVIQHSFATLLNKVVPGEASRTLPMENLFALDVEQLNSTLAPFLNADDNTNTNALYLTNALADVIFETTNPSVGIADIRFNTLQAQRTRGRISTKYTGRSTPAFPLNTNTRLPLIKLPELYYIAAEHYMRVNPSKAIDYLNEVRASRSIQEDLTAGLDDVAIQEELTKEYRKEFIAEGQLFFYYKRIGLESIPNSSTSITIDDKVYMLPYPVQEIEYGNRVQF